MSRIVHAFIVFKNEFGHDEALKFNHHHISKKQQEIDEFRNEVETFDILRRRPVFK